MRRSLPFNVSSMITFPCTLVVKVLNYFLHGYDRCCAETVFLLDLGKSGLLAFTSLAAVYGYNKTENIDIALCLDDRKCLLDGCTRCCYVLDDNDLVTVSDRAAEKDSLVTVVFTSFLLEQYLMSAPKCSLIAMLVATVSGIPL